MLNGRQLALVSRLPQSPGVIYGARIEINPDLAKRRTYFEASLTDGIAYVQAWACKWEAELRRVYRLPFSVLASVQRNRPPREVA